MYIFNDKEFKSLTDYSNLQIKGYDLTFDTTTHSTDPTIRCRWQKEKGLYQVCITATETNKFLVFFLDYSNHLNTGCGKATFETYTDLKEALYWCNLFTEGKYTPEQI